VQRTARTISRSIDRRDREPDLRCASCGYGITLRAPLPACPMCGLADWTKDTPATTLRGAQRLVASARRPGR
jgi:hypothetical protein